jgi:hypothetical protein
MGAASARRSGEISGNLARLRATVGQRSRGWTTARSSRTEKTHRRDCSGPSRLTWLSRRDAARVVTNNGARERGPGEVGDVEPSRVDDRARRRRCLSSPLSGPIARQTTVEPEWSEPSGFGFPNLSGGPTFCSRDAASLGVPVLVREPMNLGGRLLRSPARPNQSHTVTVKRPSTHAGRQRSDRPTPSESRRVSMAG